MAGADFRSFRAHELAGWNAKPASYDAHLAQVTRQVTEPLLDAAKVAPGTRLLDVASGPGHVAAAAAARGARVTGIDFAASMVAHARRNYPGLEFLEGDAEELAFPDGSFDAVTCAFGIGHLSRPDQAVAEAFRVLRRGGRYAFTWWCGPEKHEFFALVQKAVKAHGNLAVPMPPAPPNFRFSDLAEGSRTLQAAGFDAIEAHECWPVYEPAAPQDVLDLIYKSTVRTALILELQTEEARKRCDEAIISGLLEHRTGGALRLRFPANVVSGARPSRPPG
jgi:SAM-dependent methyltransferase